MQEEFDAIVIGGGPAGAMAAVLLSRLSWRVALIERGARCRAKACGHCLSPRALPLLRRHGLLDGVSRLARGRTHSLRIHLLGRQPVKVAITPGSGAPAGLLVDRADLDQFLVDSAAAAGAVVFQPAPATVIPSGDAPLVNARLMSEDAATAAAACGGRTLRAPLIIGADGLGGGVARAAGLAQSPVRGRKYGFSFDFPESPDGADEAIPPGVVSMFVGDRGYIGAARTDDGATHIAGLARVDAHSARGLRSFCAALAMRHPALSFALGRGALAPQRILGAGPMPYRPDRPANSRFALIGDAAGYDEPFTGEGMAWALESAEALAESVADRRPGEWSIATAQRYTLLWRRRVAHRQAACRLMSLALERPAILERLADAAADCRGLGPFLMRRVLAA